MEAAHDRYDEFAVGHVLGGLDPVDAAEFRSHLVGCRSCRLRVAELRDLASELAAAEREERAAARVQTQVREEHPSDEPPDPSGDRRWGRGALPLVAVVAAVVLAVGFWVFQLRDRNDTLMAATSQRETTLAMLAEAQQVEPQFADGVTGIVVVDDTQFAMTVSGVPAWLPDGQVLAVWLEATADGDDLLVEAMRGGVADGRLALHAPRGSSEAVVVTVQPVGSVVGPAGRELVRAPFPTGTRDETTTEATSGSGPGS